jgi:hypothetical protein
MLVDHRLRFQVSPYLRHLILAGFSQQLAVQVECEKIDNISSGVTAKALPSKLVWPHTDRPTAV